MSFSERSSIAGHAWIEFDGWRSAQPSHGFCTRSFDDRQERDPWSRIKVATGSQAVLLNQQTHSNICLDLRADEVFSRSVSEMGSIRHEVVADAMVVPSRRKTEGAVVCGIITADCLPILVRTQHSWGLIHAGWRGLANGIIEQTLALLRDETDLEAVIGPCAGCNDYEVGPEVIAAIGSSCVSTRGEGDRSFLDLAQTAARQLRQWRPGTSVHCSGISTMQDNRFFSYRREGAGTGRNLSFCVVASTLPS